MIFSGFICQWQLTLYAVDPSGLFDTELGVTVSVNAGQGLECSNFLVL